MMCEHSDEFQALIRNVRRNPCHSEYTIKIPRDGSGQVSVPLHQCLGKYGFEVKDVKTYQGVDDKLHYGRVATVPCTFITVTPNSEMKLPPQSFYERMLNWWSES